MSLIMDSEQMRDAYGPDGPDAEDLAIWKEAVERNCDHLDALDLMESSGRDSIYCPTCGTEVERDRIEQENGLGEHFCPYAAAEARAFGWMA